MEIQIPVRSNQGAYKVQGHPKLVNAYMELGGEDQKSRLALIPSAGLKTFGSDMNGTCRGMIYLEDDELTYTVQGFGVYKVEENGTNTKLGIVPGTGPVYFARNDATTTQIVLVIDTQVFTIENDVLSLKIDYDFTPQGVTFIGGYFIFWTAEGRFYASELQSTTVTSLNFVTAESNPDGLTFCAALGDTLYAVGKKTTEIWAISGGSGFPLAKVRGAHLNIGSNSPHSVQEFNNALVWIGNDEVVYEVSGYTATPISTPAITKLIQDDTAKASIVCFTHQRGENKFLVVRGSTYSQEYNAKTGFWIDRVTGINDQWRAVYHVKAWNKDLFGDADGNLLLEADYDLFTEVGDVLSWGFDTSTIHDYPNPVSFNKVSFEAEAGDGESLTDEGEMMLSWSDDDGRIFKNERRLSLGKTGEYGKLVESSGLGQCKKNGRIFRIRITDPVIRAIAIVDVDAEAIVA
jgi:hypothetical protein